MALFGFDVEFLLQALKSTAVGDAAKFLIKQASTKLKSEKGIFVRQDPLYAAKFYEGEKNRILRKTDYLQALPYVEVENFVTRERRTRYVGDVVDEDFTLNSELAEYADKVFAVFLKKKRKTYDDFVLRVADLVEPSQMDDVRKLVLQRTTYFDAVKTNFTLDYPLRALKVRLTKHGANEFCKDLREFEASYGNGGGEYKLKPFKDSVLANLIGVACILYLTEEQKVVISERKRDQAIFEDMPGPSSSGTVKFPMTKHPVRRLKNILNYLEDEMLREIAEEINLPAARIDNLVPLAFCRELIRGGLPQFFFLGESTISWRDLKQKAPLARDFHFEFEKIDWDELMHKKLEKYSEKEKRLLGVFVNAELTTNLLYARDYLLQEHK